MFYNVSTTEETVIGFADNYIIRILQQNKKNYIKYTKNVKIIY